MTTHLDLRRGIDFIGVTVVFFCHDGQGRLLMHKRSQNCRDEQGRWDVGGGAMEFGESFESAVRREIKEEYCTDPLHLEFIQATNIIRQKGEQTTHWIALLFSAQLDPSQVAIGDPKKMDDIGWFTSQTLPSPTHSKFPDCFDIINAHVSHFT